MHIAPPASTPRTNGATPPAGKPAPAQGQSGDFSQLLKTAQAGTPAAADKTGS